jgi:hypothetical protein
VGNFVDDRPNATRICYTFSENSTKCQLQTRDVQGGCCLKATSFLKNRRIFFLIISSGRRFIASFERKCHYHIRQ